MAQSTKTYPGVAREFVKIMTNVAVPYHEPPKVILRRRIVVAIVLAIGSALLGYLLARKPGDTAFFWLMLLLAAVWMVGALLAGPLHLGSVRFRGRNERPVFTGTGIGLALGALFLLGGLLARQIPVLATEVTKVVEFASHGSWRLVVLLTLVNGVAQEMFFRGALYTSLGRHYPLTISTLLFVAATMASGNPMLGFAALVLGAVCGLERRATGGVLASILTHLVWGLIMVLALPPLFGVGG